MLKKYKYTSHENVIDLSFLEKPSTFFEDTRRYEYSPDEVLYRPVAYYTLEKDGDDDDYNVTLYDSLDNQIDELLVEEDELDDIGWAIRCTEEDHVKEAKAKYEFIYNLWKKAKVTDVIEELKKIFKSSLAEDIKKTPYADFEVVDSKVSESLYVHLVKIKSEDWFEKEQWDLKVRFSSHGIPSSSGFYGQTDLNFEVDEKSKATKLYKDFLSWLSKAKPKYTEHIKAAIAFKSKIESRYIIRADYKKYLGKLWVHYTTHEELKFNYKPFHFDPIGIYFFPESFRTKGSWHVKPYKFTAKIKPEAHVLDISKIKTPEDVKEYLNKLKVEYTSDGSLEESDKIGRWFWWYIRDKFTGRKGAMTKLFLNAGYDAIFDDTDSIFTGEDQLIVLNPKILTEVKRIDQGATGYKEVAKAREVILDLLKGHDGKVIEAKKPRKKKGWVSDPAFIESKIFFEKEEDGRKAVFTIQTTTESIGGRRRAATEINLNASGSSPSFQKHLGVGPVSYGDKHTADVLTWRLEEFDPTQIKPWLEKFMHMLWDDEEVLKEKKKREDFRKKLELQRNQK